MNRFQQFLMAESRPRATLFPYTTLFRSDASSITGIRTAAVSAVATRALARTDVRTLAILGSGVQATTHIGDRKSTRLNSSHGYISYAVFCSKKKTTRPRRRRRRLR